MNKKPVLWSLASLVVLAALLLSACGAAATTAAPVATQAPASTTAPVATQAPATVAATAAPATTAPTAVVPTCGTAPVVLNGYFETGFDLPFKLSAEFTKEYPKVTWNISQDQFANLITSAPLLLASDNPPDLLRLPTMVSYAKDGLLMNLDSYATAFGWDKWPVPPLNQNRVAAAGQSLYEMLVPWRSAHTHPASRSARRWCAKQLAGGQCSTL